LELKSADYACWRGSLNYVVLQGGRADKGMGAFGKDLKPEDAVAVREYLI
jgi:hypothetical protein